MMLASARHVTTMITSTVITHSSEPVDSPRGGRATLIPEPPKGSLPTSAASPGSLRGRVGVLVSGPVMMEGPGLAWQGIRKLLMRRFQMGISSLKLVAMLASWLDAPKTAPKRPPGQADPLTCIAIRTATTDGDRRSGSCRGRPSRPETACGGAPFVRQRSRGPAAPRQPFRPRPRADACADAVAEATRHAHVRVIRRDLCAVQADEQVDAVSDHTPNRRNEGR